MKTSFSEAIPGERIYCCGQEIRTVNKSISETRISTRSFAELRLSDFSDENQRPAHTIATSARPSSRRTRQYWRTVCGNFLRVNTYFIYIYSQMDFTRISSSPILPEVKTETSRLNRATHGILILKTILVRDGLIRMSDLAPDDLLQHSALAEPRNSEPPRGMWGGIRDVLGHPITQGGLLQGQTVLTLKKEVTVFALLLRGECNQRLIQFATQYYAPSARASFCAAGLGTAETSVSN